jgi:hypothetical protein
MKIFIFLLHILFTTLLSSSEIRVYQSDVKSINLKEPKPLRFSLDDNVIRRLSFQKYEFFDPTLLTLSRSPLILIIEKNDQDYEKISLHRHVQTANHSCFIKYKFKKSNDLLINIEQDLTFAFKAKKLPILTLISRN